jgi:hypothetical protein
VKYKFYSNFLYKMAPEYAALNNAHVQCKDDFPRTVVFAPHAPVRVYANSGGVPKRKKINLSSWPSIALPFYQ